MAAGASQSSGPFVTSGYAELVGILFTSSSLVSPSGLRIWQSGDSGSNWDYYTDYAVAAETGCAFTIAIVGDMARIDVRTDSAASVFRTAWRLRPV